VNTAEDVVETTSDFTRGVGTSLELLSVTLGKETIASSVTDVHEALGGCARELEHLNVVGLAKVGKSLLGLSVEVLGAHGVDLVDDNENELVGEKRLDRLEKLHLGLN